MGLQNSIDNHETETSITRVSSLSLTQGK